MSHILVLSSLLFAVPALTQSANPVTAVKPSATLSPEEVVQIVIQALKENDTTDEGIATVYRFASPGNKINTGPLDRFSRMIKIGFSNMLNHRSSRFGTLKMDNGTALQPVHLTTSAGDEVAYLFQMSQQTMGEFEGMWMTEAVYPLPAEGQSI